MNMPFIKWTCKRCGAVVKGFGKTRNEQYHEMMTASVSHKLECWQERRPTMLAPDKGQAAAVKDNLGSAPCG